MIENIFSFLVYPRDKESSNINGKEMPLSGKLFDLMDELFNKAESECKIEISFNHSDDGTQTNSCRSEILDIIKNRDLANSETLAMRLHNITTNRSGIGLMFVVLGKHNDKDKILICRFPADHGIVAEEKSSELEIQFIEKVFMKNAHAYKSVYYTGSSINEFWSGWAIDKQLNHTTGAISTYWIKDFLISDFKTTSAAGTRRLAIALRETVNSVTELSIKQEITSAAALSKVFEGKTINFADYANHFGFSDETKKSIQLKLKKDAVANDHFVFSNNEFCNHMQYKSIELDNGAIMSASLASFDECFRKEAIAEDRYKFTAEGNIKTEKLKKSR